jgi:hypothetical protein
LLAAAVVPRPAAAQIKMDADGDVAIGAPDFSGERKFSIRYPNGSYGAQGLFVDLGANSSEMENDEATAVVGRSVPSDGKGIGARFVGGSTGLKSQATSSYAGEQYSDRVGVRTSAGGGARNIGVRLASKARGYSDARNTGIYGRVGTGKSATGMRLDVGATYHTRAASDGNIGVKVTIGGPDGNARDDDHHAIGLKINSKGNLDYAGYFEGDVVVTGQLNPSDRKLKDEIRGLGRGLSGEVAERVRANAAANGPGPQQAGGTSARSSARAKLLRLAPKRFAYDTAEYDEMGLPEGEQLGLIAQDVREAFPSMVEEVRVSEEVVRGEDGTVVERTEAMSYLSVNYTQLIPVLVQTAREQQAELDAARAENEALREELDALKTALRSQGIQTE